MTAASSPGLITGSQVAGHVRSKRRRKEKKHRRAAHSRMLFACNTGVSNTNPVTRSEPATRSTIAGDVDHPDEWVSSHPLDTEPPESTRAYAAITKKPQPQADQGVGDTIAAGSSLFVYGKRFWLQLRFITFSDISILRKREGEQ